MKVKEAIAALCKVLVGVWAGDGASPAALSPEIFRKAKFNRNEATAEFWKLLYWLLKLVNQDRPCEVTDLAEQIDYVKAAVCYYGYGFMDFYQLPADGTQGSQDLLLAFSWLLQRIHLLEQLLNLQRLHVEDHASLCTCRRTIPVSSMERLDIQDSRHPVGMDVRYLQCLQGKLRFRWRSLYSAQQERCSALYKIHLYTRGCGSSQSFDHLSATEIRLIQDPKQCTEFVQHLERENMQLEAYLEWKQLEPLYWQWMQSVLSAKLQDTQDLLNVNVVTVTGRSLGQRGNCRQPDIFRETDKLYGELLKLHSELQDRRMAKDERMNDQERGMGDPLGQPEAVFLTQHDLEQKLAEVQARVNHGRRRHGHVRLALRANSNPIRIKPHSAQQHNSSGSLTALEVITQLKAEAVTLKKELQELQQLSKEALEEILERLDGVICLPPMQR
ncbi:tubulin epsilon and delta complex protein 1 [Carcharodon carcharias]|uniref:tubulin epsilon and delta complex protein 1 n=1 Tax=Carcharodon carcharias TaxID=13397 RepID=UPI001B7E3FA9|nr:tubulin epsilon and delta complex protein 1 [Carcharodon carcharias]